MQILQVIKRQSTVRTFQEIYSYWKGNKCLTWNGYNENFDSVSQQEILSLKTSLVSIFPSSFENCHSGYSSHFYFILFPSLFFFNLENDPSWWEQFSLAGVCLLSSPGLLLEPFMSWNSIHISTSIFMLLLRNQLVWTRSVSLLISFPRHPLGESMCTSYSVMGNGILLLRPSSPPRRTISPDLHYFPKKLEVCFNS